MAKQDVEMALLSARVETLERDSEAQALLEARKVRLGLKVFATAFLAVSSALTALVIYLFKKETGF